MNKDYVKVFEKMGIETKQKLAELKEEFERGKWGNNT